MTDIVACAGEAPGWPCLFVRVAQILWKNKTLQSWSHQCWIEDKDYFPQSAGFSPDCAARKAIGLCCKDALLAHHLFRVHQLLESCFPAGQSPACISNWVYCSPGADFAFAFSELPEVPASPFLHLSRSLLVTVLPSVCFSYSGVVCKFAESTLCPTI